MSNFEKNFRRGFSLPPAERHYLGSGHSAYTLNSVDERSKNEVTIELSTAGARVTSVIKDGKEIINSPEIDVYQEEEVIRIGTGDFRVR